MSAKFVDALKGYEYYLSQRGEATRDEVNQFLQGDGRHPISARTYGHYESLRTHGFRSYVPINKFDVFQALGQLQMAADRRRYGREEIELPAKLSLDGKRWTPATLTDKSLVGFGGVTSTRVDASPGDLFLVRIEGFHDIPCILVWAQTDRNFLRFGLRAVEFIANFSVKIPEDASPRPTNLFTMRRRSETSMSWSELFRVLSKTDELFSATEAFIHAVAELAGRRILLVSPTVTSIKFASPGDVQIKIDFGVAEIIKVVFEKLRFWGDQKRRSKAETRKMEPENANLEIEVMRNALKLKKEAAETGLSAEVIGELITPALEVIGERKMPSKLLSPASLEAGIVRERLLPAAAELIAGDDPEFDVSIEAVKITKR